MRKYDTAEADTPEKRRVKVTPKVTAMAQALVRQIEWQHAVTHFHDNRILARRMDKDRAKQKWVIEETKPSAQLEGQLLELQAKELARTDAAISAAPAQAAAVPAAPGARGARGRGRGRGRGQSTAPHRARR